ncbi:MAG: hypothetical protein ABF303_07435, partial [Desulfobacterales bacterium]
LQVPDSKADAVPCECLRAPQPAAGCLLFRPARHESSVNRKQASQKKEKTGNMTILYAQK